jgi:hypothetical protein
MSAMTFRLYPWGPPKEQSLEHAQAVLASLSGGSGRGEPTRSDEVHRGGFVSESLKLSLTIPPTSLRQLLCR